jgi:hypothetical protein
MLVSFVFGLTLGSPHVGTAQNAGDVAGEVLDLGSTKEVMEGHDRQRITGTSDTWVKDRPRRLQRFVLIYFLIGADGTQP